jgi:hypothetical protein
MAYDRERQEMKRAANWTSGETHQLIALREHPSVDGWIVREVWGHGSEQEMRQKAIQKAEANPEYDFIVEEE